MSQSPPANDLLERYDIVVGLEVHCQLNTKSKLFCSCTSVFGSLPNENTCPVCMALPGVLPVLNEKVVDAAIKLALATSSQINERSIFARKQYFYPDLPKGYQISQFDRPYCENGYIELDSGKKIRLHRIHIEEDAGKNVHGDNSSFVDLNRAGIPLLEIVSEPDINSPEEASEYLKKMRALVRYLGISDGNLEEGSFRCDANVSVKKKGDSQLGVRTEIKNLNSFKNIERAITYEVFRQVDLLDHAQSVEAVTLLFDASSGKTQVMRSKEESQDYRYFPDPDLAPLVITSERIDEARKELPELPEMKKQRFIEELALGEAEAAILVSEKELADYFEKALEALNDKASAKLLANWLLGEWMAAAHQQHWDLGQVPLEASWMAKLIDLIVDKTISGKIAKSVFEFMLTEAKDPETIVKEKALVQIVDESAIRNVVAQVLDANPLQVEQYLAGKQKVRGFFVGQIMKQSQGKFNPEKVNQILDELLSDRDS